MTAPAAALTAAITAVEVDKLLVAKTRMAPTSGYTRIITWLQMPVTATAKAADARSTRSLRRKPKDSAIPSGAPPGSTVVSAVEACVKASAPGNDSCGRTAIHGRAVVTMSSSDPTASAAIHGAEMVPSRCATLP